MYVLLLCNAEFGVPRLFGFLAPNKQFNIAPEIDSE